MKKRWNKEDLNYLKENYLKEPTKDISLKLNRSEYSIRRKYNRLNKDKPILKKWNKEDIIYLKENYLKIPAKDLALVLNRTEYSIRNKLSGLKLIKNKKINKPKNWSSEEENYLIENYYDIPNKELSLILNRSEDSIMSKATNLKLVKNKDIKSKAMIKRNKEVGRDLNYENLKNIALLYKTRGEFQMKDLSAYSVARKGGLLDDICSHMVKVAYSIPQLILAHIVSVLIDKNYLYNTRKIINPYELDIYFEKHKLAFEYDGKGWHKNDSVDKYKLCKDKDIELITISENNRKYELDVKNQLIENLDIINKITGKNINVKEILDISIPDSIFDRIFDEKKIKEICDGYTEYRILKKKIKIYTKDY